MLSETVDRSKVAALLLIILKEEEGGGGGEGEDDDEKISVEEIDRGGRERNRGGR